MRVHDIWRNIADQPRSSIDRSRVQSKRREYKGDIPGLAAEGAVSFDVLGHVEVELDVGACGLLLDGGGVAQLGERIVGIEIVVQGAAIEDHRALAFRGTRGL